MIQIHAIGIKQHTVTEGEGFRGSLTFEHLYIQPGEPFNQSRSAPTKGAPRSGDSRCVIEGLEDPSIVANLRQFLQIVKPEDIRQHRLGPISWVSDEGKGRCLLLDSMDYIFKKTMTVEEEAQTFRRWDEDRQVWVKEDESRAGDEFGFCKDFRSVDVYTLVRATPYQSRTPCFGESSVNFRTSTESEASRAESPSVSVQTADSLSPGCPTPSFTDASTQTTSHPLPSQDQLMMRHGASRGAVFL